MAQLGFRVLGFGVWRLGSRSLGVWDVGDRVLGGFGFRGVSAYSRFRLQVLGP